MPDPKHFKKTAKEFLDEFVGSLNIGEFQGQFSLKWLTPELFHYIPDPNDPFRYLRKNSAGKVIETITPLEMDTNGGSIPQIAQVLLGTSAWGYGPAFMIHDWEFAAHYMAQENPSFKFKKTFNQVNRTLAEAIWTLMNKGYNKAKAKKDPSNVQNIYAGVMSPIGKHIWNKPPE